MSIRQEIVKWADDVELREKGLLDNLERELERTEAALHRNRLQSQIAATKLNITRRKTFRAFDGANNQCPDCWMSEERRSSVRAISSSDRERILRCEMCRGEWRYQAGF